MKANTSTPIKEFISDLQLVDLYCEECRSFVNPKLFRQINDRGLYDIVNFLPKDIYEAKAIARARLMERGQYFGDPEIDEIAGKIQRLETLKKKLYGMNMTEVNITIPILDEMIELSEYVKDYFKK